MKSSTYLSVGLLFLSTLLVSQDAFITSWRTSTNNENITIPTHPNFTYFYDIDWGDGQSDTDVTGDITHTYANSGIYQVSITGTFPAIYINDSGDKDKLFTIDQWGDIEWQTFENAFDGASGMTYNATDIPDTRDVTRMGAMFRDATMFNGDINNWDVSNVTNFNATFSGATNFNSPLDQWKMSSATSLLFMFFGADSFNQDIGDWDVSNAVSMRQMFTGADQFNQDIGDWDVSSVSDMAIMFLDADSFNQDIGDWDVSSVTQMGTMFGSATSFNQDIGDWDVSNASILAMFRGATSFNQDISDWDVSNVTNMHDVFNGAISFNQDISEWDVSNVTDMRNMFRRADSFNQDISEWDVSNVEDFTDMLDQSGLSTANYDNILIGWSAQDLEPFQDFGVQGLTYCDGVQARDQIINTRGWTFVGDTEDCGEFITTWETDVDFQDITIPVRPGFTYLYDIDWGDGTIDTDVTGSITHNYINKDQYQVTISGDYPAIYLNNSGDIDKLVSIDQWGITQWQALDQAFFGASNMIYNATDVPDLSQVTSLRGMFTGASSFNGDIGDWNVSTITDMGGMFFQASSFNRDIGDWNVSNVIDMTLMFEQASSFNQDLSNWDVSSVLLMEAMFELAQAFDQDLSDWDISNASSLNAVVRETGLSVYHYDQLLISWSEQNVTSDVDFDGGGLAYCTGADGREHLMTAHGWTFDSDTEDCDSPRPFVTTWETTTQNESITIPHNPNFFVYDYTVDWGDGAITTGVTGSVSHTYFNPGMHKIMISGTFPSIYINDSGDKEKLISIDQWGNIEWSTMDNAFYGASNMTYNALDAPLLDNVTDLSDMFRDAASFNGNINDWDVGNVENFEVMFRSATSFNQPLEDWNMSSALKTNGMFFNAQRFNQDLSEWSLDLFRVTDMNFMFFLAEDFNQDISGWDVFQVTNMSSMFRDAVSFNQDISNWDIRNVTNMSNMLDNSGMSTFNYDQLLIEWSELAVEPNVNFGASNITYCLGSDARADLIATHGWTFTDAGEDCGDLFITSWRTSSPNETISIPTNPNFFIYDYDIDWGDGTIDRGVTSNITHTYVSSGIYEVKINGKFPAIYINNSGDKDNLQSIDQWGTIRWETFENAFYGASNMIYNATDLPDNREVTRMSNMFRDAGLFNGNINNWNVSNVTHFNEVFRSAVVFNQPLNNWDMRSAIKTNGMFFNALNFNRPINSWGHDLGNVNDMNFMFFFAEDFNQDLSNWDVNGVEIMTGMFQEASNFNQDITQWDVSSATRMNNMFLNADSFNQDIGSWDINNVTNMANMLSFSGISLSNFDNILNGWSAQLVNDNVTLGANGLEYCAGLPGFDDLTNNDSWTIVGATLNCTNTNTQPCMSTQVNTWTASSPGSWNNAANWSLGTIPNVCDEVFIPSGSDVDLTANGECFSLEIALGAQVEFSGFELTVWVL